LIERTAGVTVLKQLRLNGSVIAPNVGVSGFFMPPGWKVAVRDKDGSDNDVGALHIIVSKGDARNATIYWMACVKTCELTFVRTRGD